jgi:hypothetical protein
MTEPLPKTEKRLPRIEILDEAIVEVLRRKSPAERLEMAMAANRLVRMRLEGHLYTLHPDWNAKQIQEEIARRVNRGPE